MVVATGHDSGADKSMTPTAQPARNTAKQFNSYEKCYDAGADAADPVGGFGG